MRSNAKFYIAFPIRQTLSAKLSWSHYTLLMQIDNKPRRTFYIEECEKALWSVRQLKRQIDTLYYDRILASIDKKAVQDEINLLEPKPEYERIIKDPYVLEFLNLEANNS